MRQCIGYRQSVSLDGCHVSVISLTALPASLANPARSGSALEKLDPTSDLETEGKKPTFNR